MCVTLHIFITMSPSTILLSTHCIAWTANVYSKLPQLLNHCNVETGWHVKAQIHMAKLSSLPCLPPKQGYHSCEKSPWAWSSNTDSNFLGESRLVQTNLMLGTVIGGNLCRQLHCKSQFPCLVKYINIIFVIRFFLQVPLGSIMLNVICKVFHLNIQTCFQFIYEYVEQYWL